MTREQMSLPARDASLNSNSEEWHWFEATEMQLEGIATQAEDLGCEFICGPSRTRACDPLIMSQVIKSFSSTYENPVEQVRKMSIMHTVLINKGDYWVLVSLSCSHLFMTINIILLPFCYLFDASQNN